MVVKPLYLYYNPRLLQYFHPSIFQPKYYLEECFLFLVEESVLEI